MTAIECKIGFGTSNIDYVRYGTIGWLKTTNNEIRQCKCMGAIWETNKGGYLKPTYEWKVAGITEHQFGGHCNLEIGTIYQTEKYAQHGYSSYHSCAGGLLQYNGVLSVHGAMHKKYGIDINKCIRMSGTWDNILSLQCYGISVNNAIALYPTAFNIKLDKEGIDVYIPMLDGCVDNKHRYPTYELAQAACKPLKTYLLEEDDE